MAVPLQQPKTKGASVIHPIFQAILRPYMPPEQPKPTPEAIDAAILADKLADGYNKRKIEQAIKLEERTK